MSTSLQSFFIEIGARLSPFLRREFTNPAFENLRHVEVFTSAEALAVAPSEDTLLLHDLVQKALFRGRSPFTSYEIEKLLIGEFGGEVGLSVPDEQAGSSLDYAIPQTLVSAYNNYSDFLTPWCGNVSEVPLDPQNPQNERQLMTHLKDFFGDRLLHCLFPQFELSTVLGEDKGKNLLGQHGDFLIALPNGKSFIIEPGDHDTAEEQVRDAQRDSAMRAAGIETFRCKNAQISDTLVHAEIAPCLERLGALPYLSPVAQSTETATALERLFLLPSLIARTEWILNDAFLLRGLLQRDSLSIAVYEQDLPVFELALWSYIRRLHALSKLYGIKSVTMPTLHIALQRRTQDALCMRVRQSMPELCSFEESLPDPNRHVDLSLDLAIKCNHLTPPVSQNSTLSYAIRNAYKFDQPFSLRYRSRPRPIDLTDDSLAEASASVFLRDFFRKAAFREGQWPIIRQVMQQKDTIGLLPTSAGKSICFQLAALLTPGTTLVVAPTTALIDDQVQGMQETYGITRAMGWHSGVKIPEELIGTVLSGNLLLFVSPERLLRPKFRVALKGLNASDIFINYTVADEAHCVSMWGQDFRPSYLSLKYNFTEYCSFQNYRPVVVALTGTASQLVLIDLKTILEIPSMDAIVRPKSFERKELSFSLALCNTNSKGTTLDGVLASIAHRLGITDVRKQAWGIVFAYTPKELWSYFGHYVGGADNQIQTVLSQIDNKPCPIGICTGSKPNDVALTTDQWDDYKRKTMQAMKRGDVRLLFGNTTVSVGVDCERINYIVNLRMPQSMEAFYQQCGRAGRKGQQSECVLMFSDDSPEVTKKWLATREKPAQAKWDDIGTVIFFHSKNFPGRDEDFTGACAILDSIFTPKPKMDDGRVLICEVNDSTERYVSYALVLGIIDDYEVTGFGAGTVYRVRLHPIVIQIKEKNDGDAARLHLCKSLHTYLSRYRPCTIQDIEQRFETASGATLRQKALRLLIDFIYERIEQRRVASISTMVSYCNMKDTSPQHLKKTLTSYFDRSEKFAALLDAMSSQKLAVELVADILKRVEGFDDGENLFWETRRFLDEQFRADIALLNLFSILYRELTITDLATGLWRDSINELKSYHDEDRETACRLIGLVLQNIATLDTESGQNTGGCLVIDLIDALYDYSGLLFVDIADNLTGIPNIQTAVRAVFVSRQTKEVLNVSRFEQIA